MRILRPEIWACEDCTIWLCNADDSGMDEGRALIVRDACAEQGPNICANFEAEENRGIQEYPSDACEICKFEEPRYLHRFAELGEGPEELDHDGAREYPIANSGEHDATFRTQLFLMWIGDGAYTAKNVYIWADSFEDAFEELVEWADEVCPGYLAKSEELLADMTPEERAEAEETGEIPDYTCIGHTTLNHGDFVASWCWGGNEVTYEPTVQAVRLLCA